VEYDGEKYVTAGTGMYYYPQDKFFRFMEDHDHSSYNGMYFQRSISDEYGNYFQAGFAENGKHIGPHLFFKKSNKAAYKNEKFEMIFSVLNENSLDEGPSIAIYPDNTFDIIKYVNGQPFDIRIRFGFGKLYLERAGESGSIDILDCGWKFEPIYVDISPEYCFGFEGYGIKPSRTGSEKINGSYSHLYYGAVMTYGQQQEYYFKNNKHVFINEVYRYGIVEFAGDCKYFGEIKANGKDGDYYRHGFGCYRGNGECYLGYYKYSERSYWGILQKKDCTYFAQFENKKMEGLVFEKRADKLIIATYKQGKRVSNYYEIDNDTFDVVERDEKGNIKNRASFSEPKNKEVELTKEDKISPNVKMLLQNYNLSYVIEDNLDIYVTGSTLPKEKVVNLFIPDCVKGIKSEAFAGYNKLRRVSILGSISYIGDGAFRDCDNIEEVELPNLIDTIGPYTFTSKRLENIKIPYHVSLIKDYAFSECKNLRYAKVENNECVIEKYAFPAELDYLNGKNTPEGNPKVKAKAAKRKKKNDKIVEKIKKQAKRKEKAEAAKAKTGAVFRRVGEFFTGDIVKFFSIIGGFFVGIFGTIKDFFVDTIPDFFSRIFRRKSRYRSRSYYGSSFSSKIGSFFGAIGNFFVMIGKGILVGLCAPFKLIGVFLSGGGGVIILGVIIMGLYVFLAATGFIVYIEWDVSWYVPNAAFFGYNWGLVLLGVNIMNVGGLIPFLFGLVLTVVGAIIDFILYVIMALIIYAIPHIIQILLQLILVFGIPGAIPIGCLVLLIKGDNKIGALITFIISLALAVIYFIFLTPLLQGS